MLDVNIDPCSPRPGVAMRVAADPVNADPLAELSVKTAELGRVGSAGAEVQQAGTFQVLRRVTHQPGAHAFGASSTPGGCCGARFSLGLGGDRPLLVLLAQRGGSAFVDRGRLVDRG